MDDLPFSLHRRAFFTMTQLTPEERAAVKAQVGKLVGLAAEQWPSVGVRRLDTDEPEYLVDVDDSLLAFVRPVPGAAPELLDIISKERLRVFAGQQL